MSEAVREIRKDNLSGASELLVRAAEVLREHAASSRARSLSSFARSLARVGRQLADAQPAMAPFINLADAALQATDGADDVAGAKDAVVAAIDDFVAFSAEEGEATARTAAKKIRNGSVVMVYSRSSTVEKALLLAAEGGKRFSVLCPESRPGMEGRILATRLAKAKIPVTAFVDAAAFSLFQTADMVLIGADALVPVGLINKIGTSGLVMLSEDADVPVWCLAGRTKMLPSAALIDPHREGETLATTWEDRPRGVRLLDRYYDLTALGLLRGYVVGRELLTPAKLRSRLRSIRLHPELAKKKPRARAGSARRAKKNKKK